MVLISKKIIMIYAPTKDGCKEEFYDLNEGPLELNNILDSFLLFNLRYKQEIDFLKEKVINVKDEIHNNSNEEIQTDNLTISILKPLGCLN